MASTVYTKFRIPDFSHLINMERQVFHHKRDANLKFLLGLYPMDHQNVTLHDEVMIKLECLYRNPYIHDAIPVAIKLSIIDSNYYKCYTQDYRWNFNEISGHFLTKFISRDILLDSAEQMLPNDVLTLFCEVKILTDLHPKQDIRSKITNEIVRNYQTLLESGEFSDVRLIVGSMEKDGEEVKEFAVHKMILSARSEVFAAMFKHSNTREAQQNRVEIPDVRVPVFEQFLQFIYTAKVGPVSYDDAVELFEVADKYQIASMKEYYEQHLCENLEIESLAQTLLLADMHQANKLKSKCLEFFVLNGEQVMKTVGWTKISNKPDLLLEVVQCFVNSKRFKGSHD